MSKQAVSVRELHDAAEDAGWTMEKMTDPSQGYNTGWGLFEGGRYVAGSFSFRLETVNERLCDIGRARLAARYCELCDHDATEFVDGHARCLDCQLQVEALTEGQA